MMTITGEYLTLEGGAPSLEALAQGLARMPRYAGQTTVPGWSVADHLIFCARVAQRFTGWPSRLELHAALHDAHEAMTGDIPVPFKTPDMKKLQAVLDGRIYAALQLDPPTVVERNLVKVIDEEALLAEAAVVCPEHTYQRIIEERGHEANYNFVGIVDNMLHSDIDSETVWRENVERLLRTWARTPTVCDPMLKVVG